MAVHLALNGAGALRHLIQDPVRRKALGAQARKDAAAKVERQVQKSAAALLLEPRRSSALLALSGQWRQAVKRMLTEFTLCGGLCGHFRC